MRTIKLAPLSILLIFLAAAVGCDSGSTVDTGADPNALDTDEFAVLGAEDAFANVEDADLDRPMRMNPVMHGGRFARHARHRDEPASHLKGILRNIGLSSEQMTQIRALLMAHRERVMDDFEGLRAANAAIIEESRLKREAILESLRNEEITREQARAMLRELSERTHEAIRNNPENAPFFEAICDSKLELFDGVRAVLEPTQQEAWDAWVAGLSGRCFTE